MGSEAFYTTAAQVLPTILIALAVEIGFMMQQRERVWEKAKAREFEGQVVSSEVVARMEKAFLRVGQYTVRWGTAALGVSTAFVVGELLAVLSLAFGWFNVWTFVPVLVCMMTLIVAAAVVPLLRMRSDV
ncbi:hypothetical protein ACIBQ1_52580 [Nonomuraea sp. NPDC050153]|uniref:hypothetical protein n=1 Tax=Nonomuraea sp. NPDC050153 TaxID=3364359 RepID=UPI00379D4CA8